MIHRGAIMLNKLLVDLQGSILLDSSMLADVTVKSSNFGLDEIFSIIRLPENNPLNDYAFEGKGKISARINGSLNSGDSLEIISDFSLSNGSVANKNTKSKLSHISIHGSLSGNNPKNYSLVISQFESRLSTGNIHGKGTVKNMVRPDFFVQLYSTVNLNNLNHFIDIKTTESMNGTLNVNLIAQGTLTRAKKIGISDILSCIQSGFLELEDGSAKLKGKDYAFQDVNGKINLGREISFQDFALTVNETNFLVTGKLINVFDYFIDNKSIINGNLYVYSKILRGASFIRTSTDSTNTGGIDLPERLQIKASLNADEIRLGKFNGSDLKCEFVVDETKTLNINKFNLKFIDGNIAGNALISQQGDSCLLVNCASKLDHIDIQQLFIACNNFGQSFINDENLRGKLEGNAVFTACWDDQ